MGLLPPTGPASQPAPPLALLPAPFRPARPCCCPTCRRWLFLSATTTFPCGVAAILPVPVNSLAAVAACQAEPALKAPVKVSNRWILYQKRVLGWRGLSVDVWPPPLAGMQPIEERPCCQPLPATLCVNEAALSARREGASASPFLRRRITHLPLPEWTISTSGTAFLFLPAP